MSERAEFSSRHLERGNIGDFFCPVHCDYDRRQERSGKMDNDLYEAIKQIATRFHIKCSKYSKEELTMQMRELLFDEAFKIIELE